MFLVGEDGPVFVPSALKVSCFVLLQRACRLIKEFSVGFLSCPPPPHTHGTHTPQQLVSLSHVCSCWTALINS